MCVMQKDEKEEKKEEEEEEKKPKKVWEMLVTFSCLVF